MEVAKQNIQRVFGPVLLGLIVTLLAGAALACGASASPQEPTQSSGSAGQSTATESGATESGSASNVASGGSSTGASNDTSGNASASAGKAGWPEKVRLGLIPTEANVLTQWQPVVAYLEEQLGVEVETFVGTDYTATIIAAKNNKLDVVWLGPKSYVKARTQGAELQPVVKWINEDTNIAGYNSLLITHKDSGITTIEEAKGRTFAFNDPESTSGFLVPTVFFLEREIEPQEYFSEVYFAGSHEATALAVANGKVDLASNNNETLPRLIDIGKVAEDDVRIIWESPLIPTDPVSVQASLPDSFKEAVQEAFLSYDDPEGLKELSIRGWIPATDADYDVIRTLEATKAELAAAK